MSSVISFSQGAELRAFNHSDRICYMIQPFVQEILNQLMELQNLGSAILKARESHQKVADKLFDIDVNDPAGSFSLKESLLFPERNNWQLFVFGNGRYPDFLQKQGICGVEDDLWLSELHQLLDLCGQSCFSYEQICSQISDRMVTLLNQFLKCWVVKESIANSELVPQFPLATPGVFRLQHAALLYRSKTTGILVDPHLHSNYGLPNLKQDISRAMLEGMVDGILISHSHYDHWHYPTLMMFPPQIPIIVPKVPRGSLMCEDMGQKLRSIGFTNVMDVDWYSEPILIGDIKVNVLPFYGEQVLVPEYPQPLYPELKNWGNTYLIETESYKSWFLIDSGKEPTASMVEVAEVVQQKFGTVDYILSNFQPLSYNSISSNISDWGLDIVANLLSNPQILGVMNRQEGAYLATLGPVGVAEICSILKAKACLAYADSWAEWGHPGLHDEELNQQTQRELEKLGSSTKVIPWRIGDGYFN